MFRRPFIYIILSIAAVIGVFVFGIFRAGGDGDIARAFLAHLGASEITEAYALLHTDVTSTFSFEQFTTATQNTATYTDVSFPSLSFSTENGTRITEVVGTGTTADGCESALEFEFLNGEITFFDIQPLCRTQ
mgnify:CR=1 FL=1